MKKRNRNRLLALLLALMMVVSIVPTIAFTEAGTAKTTETATEQDEASPVDSTNDAAFATDEAPDDMALAPDEDNETITDDTEVVEPLPDTDTPDAETPDTNPLPDTETIPDTEDEAPTEPLEDDNPLKAAIEANGHAYVTAASNTPVYTTADMTEDGLIYTIMQNDAVLLATVYEQDYGCVKVWLATANQEIITGYVAESALFAVLTDVEAGTLAVTLPTAWVTCEAGEYLAFVAVGEAPSQPDMPSVPDNPPVQETDQEPTVVETEQPITTEEAPQNEHTDSIEPTDAPVVDSPVETEVPVETDIPVETEEPLPAPPAFQECDYVSVTHDTRVYLEIDETLEDGYNGDFYDGVFIGDAIVQIEAVEQDGTGRYWCKVRYLYGDDFADGTLKWTETSTVYVLASEVSQTDEQELTVTDYAFPSPRSAARMLMRASAMPGFSLKNISVYIPTFYAGQGGLYGSSGKDSDYLQIAKSSEHGTIYATPHYLDGFSVYCLEHNLSGPGERISGGGQEPTGPYMIVDIDSYRNNPGYSSIIYNSGTLHAIAWVIRHSYPFMALDRSDSDNETWSRVAGQFAIREVIKQMEGAQYVRSYWDMDNFYRASGQAPAVYLEYARWLAENGIARGRMTGNINVSGKSVTAVSGGYAGTVTLTTDADKMRIRRSVGSLTGNTAGSDGTYYYLNSGDTITVTSAKNSFSISVESVSSEDEEANFLIGVPSAQIQKVIIPQYGAPYKLKSISVVFEVPLGAVSVTKKGSDSGAALSGATFELLNSAGTVIQTQATGVNGIATFSNLQPGSYTVREKSAPTGYLLSTTSTQSVTVTAGSTASVTFSNAPTTAKIKIVKKEQLTGEPLANVEFTVTRLSAPSANNTVGSVVAVLTTDASGNAETGWLDWGRYKVEETRVPPHFVDNHFSTEIEAYENGKTYTVEVENEPAKGTIKLTKTDRLDGAPIAGVQFDIYYNDQYGSGLAGTMVTGADGVAVSAPLRKGSYLVKEHGNPTGYVDELTVMETTVKPDETTLLTASNQPVQGRIRIVKKDQQTQEALAGAEFTITRVSGLLSHNGSNDGEIVAVIITEADGTALSPLLTWGTYRIDETGVPAHFVDNAYSTEAVIGDENMKTHEVVVENEPTKGWIRIAKTDRQNGNPIEGVRFDIYANDEYGSGLVGSMVTGADGVAVSEPLRKGRYIVKESGATAGYVFEEITLDATVKSDETTELVATNCHVMTRLRLYKRDAEEYDGENPNVSARAKAAKMLPDATNISAPAMRGDGVLTGTEFQVLAAETITDCQGNMVYAKGDVVIASVQTVGEDASVTTDELWPGLYKIVEIAPPTGYALDSVPFYVDTRSAAYQSQEAVIVFDGLKTNEILYGAFSIVKFTGDNQVHSDAGIMETPEKGAEFEVYLKSASSYETARDFERDYITTNKYGRAKTKALPYGVYVLRQTVGQDGYAILRPIDVMIDGTEDVKDPPSLILNNQAIHYRLRIVKVDAETGKPIALTNTAFRLKDADGNTIMQSVTYPTPSEIDTFLTDENGEVTLPETVTWGQYYVEEVQSPEGYLLNAEPVAAFVGHTGDTVGDVYEVTAEVPNIPVKGQIVLEKKGLQLTGFEAVTDAYGNEVQQPVYEEQYLAGAVFDVHASEDVIGSDGTVWYAKDELVDTITTTAEGADRSKVLPLGSYYLVETAAPVGYSFNDTRYEANLTFADNQTPIVQTTVTASNVFLPAEINLRKEKETLQTVHGNGMVRQTIINVAGEGFVFGLFNATDIHYDGGTLMADTLVATGVTDSNGCLSFSGNYPHGAYYIKELSAPAGWKLNPNSFPIVLDPAAKAEDANVIRVALPETVHDELIYTTVTLTKKAITGEKTLPSATIEVSNSAGEVIYRAMTDKNGNVPDIPVTPGKYTFREVLAPSGYELNEAVMTFTVDENGNVTGDTTIRDDYTRVTMLKQDENGKRLTGVEFALQKADGTVLMRAVSDANGIVTFEQIPYGSYTIVETKQLAGYLNSNVEIKLTVDGGFISSDKPLATITNCHKRIRYLKVDTSGKPLAGVEFSLISVETKQVMEVVTSNEQGEFIFTKFDYGDWIIRETKAPAGFIHIQDITLHVDENWTEPAPITCVNVPNHYEFIKVDGTGNPLSGVKFALEDTNGNVLRELVSGDDGIVSVTDLALGMYIIRETEAPEGFVQTEETITVTIDENYVVPTELFKLVNHSVTDIQTGVDITITPVMWTGAAMVLLAVALMISAGVKKRKRRRKTKQHKVRR